MAEPRTINLEPNWAGVKRWAENGLRTARPGREREAFREILVECELALLRQLQAEDRK